MVEEKCCETMPEPNPDSTPPATELAVPPPKPKFGKPPIPAGLPSIMPMVLARLPTEESNVTVGAMSLIPFFPKRISLSRLGEKVWLQLTLPALIQSTLRELPSRG